MSIFQLNKLTEQRAHRGPSDLVALDFATTGLKVVRIKKTKETTTILGVDLLPAVSIEQESSADEADKSRIAIPKNLLSNYAAVALSGESSVVRFLNLPGHPEKEEIMETQAREHAGLGDEYRLAYMVMPHHVRGKAETRLLVVGLPENDAQGILGLMAAGIPAPISLEVSGISAFTSFLNGPGAKLEHEAYAVLETGARVSFLGLFNKDSLVLVRKFEFGGDALVAKVQQQLGVDREVAQGVMSDGSFDISQSVHEVMDPFLRQLSVSKDYVERREECRIASINLSGGMSLSKYWVDEIRNATGVQVQTWDPFEGLTVESNAIPEKLQNQRPRFTAAIGAALGAYQSS